jgi:hypothetical protein
MSTKSSQLPILPMGNGGIPNLFRRILLSHLLTETDEFGDIRTSQRDLASLFNRSGQNTIGRHLRGICRAGYLFKAYPSTGVLPDTFWLGSRLAEGSGDHLYFSQLSSALFGNGGLMTVLGQNEALGVGCLNESGALVLGTIVANCDQIQVSSITSYLKDYVSSRSVSRSLGLLEREGIIEKSVGVVRLTSTWQQAFTDFLGVHDACCPRKNRADIRRKAEQDLNLARLNRGLLTEAERIFLRNQKCVYCDADGLQQQHFPPRRFLQSYEVINNRHFVWPICHACNDAEKNFIRGLPALPQLELILVRSSDTEISDLLSLYREESEIGIHRFHEAHRSNSRNAAHEEMIRCHILWKCIEALGATDESDRCDPVDHLVRFENTLRAPLRPRRSDTGSPSEDKPAWIRAVVRLDETLCEYSFNKVDVLRNSRPIEAVSPTQSFPFSPLTTSRQ